MPLIERPTFLSFDEPTISPTKLKINPTIATMPHKARNKEMMDKANPIIAHIFTDDSELDLDIL